MRSFLPGLTAAFLSLHSWSSMLAGPTIYMIGDSTMADKSLAHGNPERGWGQLLPEFFREDVKISNQATDGRSTKSFIDEKRWEKVVAALQPGDWVIIQFGHNDQKKDKPELYTDPATTYRENLTRFVNETVAKGAHPILATSIFRRRFDQNGKPKPTLGKYPQATRELAGKLQVPLVDLNTATEQLLAEAGAEKSKEYFLHFEPGQLPAFPEGKHDDTHLSEPGARKVAGLFVEGLRKLKSPLCEYLR